MIILTDGGRAANLPTVVVRAEVIAPTILAVVGYDEEFPLDDHGCVRVAAEAVRAT